MAKAPAATADIPAKGGRKLLMIVMIVLLVLVLAVAAVVVLLLLKKGGDEATDAASMDAPVAAAAVDLSRPPSFVALEPFVKNLQPGEGDRYVQAVISLRVPDAKTGDLLKGFTPEIRHTINLVLSNKLPSELLTQDGQEQLAREIAEKVNGVLGVAADAGPDEGPVRSVLFNSLIIQ